MENYDTKEKKTSVASGQRRSAAENRPSAPAPVVSLQISSLGAAYFFSGAGRFSLL
jgi:hypothetical protein